MNNFVKRSAALTAIAVAMMLGLSAFFGVAYVYTLLGLSVWAVFGHLVTIDDDFPGDWSNPDGSLPFPWVELAVKVAFLAALLLSVALFPALREFGAGL